MIKISAANGRFCVRVFACVALAVGGVGLAGAAGAQILIEQTDPGVLLQPEQVEITRNTPMQVEVDQIDPTKKRPQRAASSQVRKQPAAPQTATVALPKQLPHPLDPVLSVFPEEAQGNVYPRAQVSMVFG